MSKVSFNFRKSKKSIESLDGEWWSASTLWILVKPKSTQSSLSVSGCDVESGVILVPNVERRNQLMAFKDALTEIHRNLSALLRVANSNEIVDVDRFRVLSQETYIQILQTFPWVSISNTLHFFLAHAHQFIERNDRVGLCSLSDEGLEQGHKLIREFSTHLSRKSDFLSRAMNSFAVVWLLPWAKSSAAQILFKLCEVIKDVQSQVICADNYPLIVKLFRLLSPTPNLVTVFLAR
ncbi:hypothetical protein LOD99_9165 [Oopsacas minuta]|uniref:Uncharacterized protein n=1 Tax=Oopsacas minuta TaxID=111878 RepID=A0AAV7JDN8_9METZ|nr:hypothetical protein LOD99_9165 [Oopsacas minuta]